MARQATGHQEGSRWINKRPTGKEVADWFIANAPMHPGMDPARYVTGVVLIPAKEKARVAVEADNGTMSFPEVEQLVYVPYVKVETRVAYFWDWVRANPEWTGAIEPAPVAKVEHEGYLNVHLPPGFFRMPVQDQTGKFVHFLCCSMQVRIRHIDGGGFVMAPPAGTKMVATLTRWGVDEHSIMKAETGAVGRALGMAGMLVLPGSGVATAEDMQEMLAAEGRATVAVEPAVGGGDPDAVIRKKIAALGTQLQADKPGAFEELEAWAREKSIDLNDLKSHQLRGVLLKIDRALSAGAPT